jgi:hypothetical protein
MTSHSQIRQIADEGLVLGDPLRQTPRNRSRRLTGAPSMRHPATYFVTALALAGLFAASPALGKPLTAADIRKEIIGRTIFLAAPLGGEFPLNYRRGGTVDGNGTALGLGKFIAPTDRGRWWIAGNRLCQKFQVWYKGNPMCFALTKVGESRVKWVRDNGETGVARIGR